MLAQALTTESASVCNSCASLADRSVPETLA
jgi:hypothetical protein